MEELDLRIYVYSSGTLIKSRFHKIKSIEELDKIGNWYKGRKLDVQLVVTQYFSPYVSKIINVIDI